LKINYSGCKTNVSANSFATRIAITEALISGIARWKESKGSLEYISAHLGDPTEK
jgi:hypothetical protein